MNNKISRFNKQISDAPTGLVVRVKAEDIKGAICRDHQKCVIARAIMRQRKSTAKWVDVGASTVLIGTGKVTGFRYRLSEQARKQVRFFDSNDGRFAPCVVTLCPLTGRNKIGGRAGRAGGKKHSRKKKHTAPTR